MIYILAIVAYLAIGGLLAGIFDDVGVDDFVWYLGWPVVVIVSLIFIITEPFQHLGQCIVTKIRAIKNRKHK